MAAPKSVVRIKKDGIEFTDSVDREIYFIHELSRAALRDIARLVKKRFKSSFYGSFKVRSGRAGRVTKSKVWSSASTIYPRVEIGMKNAGDGGWAYFQEVGARNVPKKQLLQKAVIDNVGQITAIASAYLSQAGTGSTGGIGEGDVEE